MIDGSPKDRGTSKNFVNPIVLHQHILEKGLSILCEEVFTNSKTHHIIIIHDNDQNYIQEHHPDLCSP